MIIGRSLLGAMGGDGFLLSMEKEMMQGNI